MVRHNYTATKRPTPYQDTISPVDRIRLYPDVSYIT
jgi:hypothetical protein